MKKFSLLLFLLLLCGQSACIWKLWSKGPPPEEITYDVYGTVESMDLETLVIQTNKGSETFTLSPASVKGNAKGTNFKSGTYVHVYYQQREGQSFVTMVVEKVK